MRQLVRTVLVMAMYLPLLLTGSAWAEADSDVSNTSLNGTFRFSMVKTCADTTIGSTFHLYASGTIVYDGKGSARLAQQGTLILPGLSPTSLEEIATLTYDVKPNGSFTQEGAFVATDKSYTITGVKMEGGLDTHGSVLIFSSTVPLKKETLAIPGRGLSESFCGTSGTGVLMR